MGAVARMTPQTARVRKEQPAGGNCPHVVLRRVGVEDVVLCMTDTANINKAEGMFYNECCTFVCSPCSYAFSLVQ